jgi:hypothetical protein
VKLSRNICRCVHTEALLGYVYIIHEIQYIAANEKNMRDKDRKHQKNVNNLGLITGCKVY